MNTQPDQGPMNDIPALLAKANYPKQAVIGIGATRYTAFGERNFLQIGDTSIVVVYNAKNTTTKQLCRWQNKTRSLRILQH